MRSFLLLAAGVLAACGDPAKAVTPDAAQDGIDAPATVDSVATIVSGSRLRARYLVAADDPTARTFVGWHDAQLDVDCDWSVGNSPRCLPTHATTDVYTDAACTTPVFEQYQNYAYTHIIAGATCNGDGPLYVVGTAISPTTVYDSDGAGGCTPRVASGQYFKLTLDSAPYVTGTIVDAGTHRTRARTMHGADGSIWPVTPFDTELDTECSPFAIASEATTVCVPHHLPSLFTEDSSCTKPVAFTYGSCPMPSFVYLAGANPKLYRRGDVVLTGPATFNGFSRAGTQAAPTCTPYTRNIGAQSSVVRGGAEVPLDALPVVTSEQTPTGRLSTKRLVVGAFAQEDGFHDEPVNKDCRVVQVDVGAFRCLPPSGSVLRHYFSTDATCTTSRVIITTSGDQPIIASDTDTGPTHLFALGAAVDPATLYVGTPGNCAVYESPGGGYFELGSELGIDTFVGFTPFTE